MVHSYFTRIFSLRPSESQMVTVKQVTPLNHNHPNSNSNEQQGNMTIPTISNEHNNNKGDCGVENAGAGKGLGGAAYIDNEQATRWSTTDTTWKWSPNEEDESTSRYCRPKMLWLIAGFVCVILVISLVVALTMILFMDMSKSTHTKVYRISTSAPSSSSFGDHQLPRHASGLGTALGSDNFKSGGFPKASHKSDENSDSDSDNNDYISKISPLDKRKASKLSWDMINRSNRKPGSSGGKGASAERDEVILPAQLVFTSGQKSQGGDSNIGSEKKTRSCCRTQKYTQVIRREGCDPVTIVNRMCFGQCVSVWVPGLFASFPVCKPSRSTWKTVTLACGRKRDRRKRVKVERVKRCSCMEIEPTVPSSL